MPLPIWWHARTAHPNEQEVLWGSHAAHGKAHGHCLDCASFVNRGNSCVMEGPLTEALERVWETTDAQIHSLPPSSKKWERKEMAQLKRIKKYFLNTLLLQWMYLKPVFPTKMLQLLLQVTKWMSNSLVLQFGKVSKSWDTYPVLSDQDTEAGDSSNTDFPCRTSSAFFFLVGF